MAAAGSAFVSPIVRTDGAAGYGRDTVASDSDSTRDEPGYELMIDLSEILDTFSRAESKDELICLLSRYVHRLGFDYYSYYLHHPLPASRPNIRVFDTYSAGWMDYYQDEGYLDIDPTLTLSQKRNDVVIWNEQVFSEAQHLWSNARAAGLNHGLAQAAFGPTMSFGVLSLARSSESSSDAQVDMLRMPVMWLANQFHNSIVEKTISDELASSVKLTTREVETLKWTLDGKTAAEIGQILGISTRTVNFHINNVLNKLGVVNKTQAAVRAFSLGLLSDL